MIEKIKSVEPYQWFIGILISAFIALATIGWTQTDKRIESKASYEIVKKMLEDNRIKDERAYQDKCEQIKVNQKLLESVKMLMIKQEMRDTQKAEGSGS